MMDAEKVSISTPGRTSRDSKHGERPGIQIGMPYNSVRDSCFVFNFVWVLQARTISPAIPLPEFNPSQFTAPYNPNFNGGSVILIPKTVINRSHRFNDGLIVDWPKRGLHSVPAGNSPNTQTLDRNINLDTMLGFFSGKFQFRHFPKIQCFW